MYKLLFWLIVLSAAVRPAAAQQAKEEFKSGDRVKVILKNGGSFTGTLIRIDAERISLDTTYEMSGITSSIGFERARVRNIERVPQRDLEELKDMFADKQQEQIRLHQGQAEFKAARDRHEKAQEGLLKKEQEEQEKARQESDEAKKKKNQEEFLKGMDILKEFPPADGWGPEKYETLSTQFVRTNVPLTETEQRFVDNYSLWKNALDTFEQALKGETQKTPEEKVETETPPAPVEGEKAPAPEKKPAAAPPSKSPPSTGPPRPPSPPGKPPAEPEPIYEEIKPPK